MDRQLRTRIVCEAYKLFITKGIKNTSYTDILEPLKRSNGALTYHFPFKENLVRCVLDTHFFPDSQIPAEWHSLSREKFNLFMQMYQNPIERVICNFQFAVDSNKFAAYMQFVASAREYIDDFDMDYKTLWEQENKFLEEVIQNASARGELSTLDSEYYRNRFFEQSIGNTFLKYLS